VAASVRWGFVGAGGIARVLAPVVHAARGAVLQAVAARDPERARRLGAAGRTYAAYEDLLADDTVDAVYVALPNDAHLPWTLAALAAGKHVLCEKPLGLDAGQVRRMTAAAAAADRLLVEASWYRWHPRTRRAEGLLAAGAIGTPRRIWTGLTFPGVAEDNYRFDPAKGGGALYDVGCYAASAALWSAAWAPLHRAEARFDLGQTGVDVGGEATLTIGAANAVVRFGMAQEAQQWLAVEGDEGRLDMVALPFVSRHDGATLIVGGHAEHFAPVDPYQLMVEAVSGRIRGDVDAVVPLAQSLRVAEALDAIRAAAGPDGALEAAG
jgi:D-xylose 1-dehydrogenase (NADP+, D-xylono-1,5-lactone-forming)